MLRTLPIPHFSKCPASISQSPCSAGVVFSFNNEGTVVKANDGPQAGPASCGTAEDKRVASERTHSHRRMRCAPKLQLSASRTSRVGYTGVRVSPADGPGQF